MGRVYIKWSAEEEAAIRDGIAKHGLGKWQTILNDPEFSTVLILRTNVGIKDKWRNMITKGESRIGYKPVPNYIKKTSSHYDTSAALTIVGSNKDEFAKPEAPVIVHESLEDGASDKLILRFDDCILDGRTNAKQPSSSAQKQEQIPPPKLKRSSREDVRTVTVDGKFNEVQQEREHSLADLESVKAAVDAELMRLRQMRPEDAASAVAAFEHAKAAIAEAEEAERVAAVAERAAEEAQSVVEGLKRRLEERKARPAKLIVCEHMQRQRLKEENAAAVRGEVVMKCTSVIRLLLSFANLSNLDMGKSCP
ncbi:MYB transcription factor [Heracleum sosnowskyi]|uniref:MYB transcription factor n=1 Tax=Heracleum sosnowskyi TaxID=360622 RepID=A0AAD8HCH8_9APIA|nr:MYB transcription factor [Heracleum sosnowskyi]